MPPAIRATTSPVSKLAEDANRVFASDDFERVRRLITTMRHQLDANSKAMVYSRLSRRLRETGYRTFAEYLSWLQSPGDPQRPDEWRTLRQRADHQPDVVLSRAPHFESLALDLAIAPRRSIWCAARPPVKSLLDRHGGEETWAAPARTRDRASDIDTTVLASAQRGAYDTDARRLSPARLHAHFLRGKAPTRGASACGRHWRSVSAFARSIWWSRAGDLGESLDIVFCRNVMIYFEAGTQRRLLETSACSAASGACCM